MKFVPAKPNFSRFRPMRLFTAALALFFALLPLCGCAAQEKTETFTAMDTVMTLTVYGGGNALDDAKVLILGLEAELSVTAEGSAIRRLNEEGELELCEDAAALVSEALALCAETDGALDITVYPVVRAWGFTTGDYRVPTEEELSALLPLVDHSAVKMSGSTVTLPAGAMIDLGAVAKGYASDRAAALLREKGVKSAILNLGGNVYALGSKPDGSAWRVGVADPFGEGGTYSLVLSVTDMAVVTSGGYQRYFEQDGVIYRHIIDPETGHPVDNGLASVTIVCEEGLKADALSTALYVMGYEKAVEYWKNHGGFDAVFILNDASIHITEGLESCLASASGEQTPEIIKK